MAADVSLVRYIREASRLRHAIRLSEIDERFAVAKGRVHYILDTNVVGMFMRPAEHTKELGIFFNWLDEETLTATATLTSEFLLSKNLPGQGGESATLSPDHYEEVIGLANRTKAAVKALSGEELDRAVQAMERSRVELDALAAKLRDSKVEAQEKFNDLNAILPKEVASLVQGPLAELFQLKRAFESDCIYRVDGMDWFHASALAVDTKKELEWLDRIRAARRGIAKSKEAHGLDVSPQKYLNEMRDARTMALIIQLTEEFADEEKERFLFVTADGAIRRAVEAAVREAQDEGKAEGLDVFVRHPREFVPLLNLGNISGEDELRSVFFKLKITLDELLTGIGPPDDDGAVYVEPTDEEIERSLALGGGPRGSSSPDTRARLTELQDLWRLACRSALSLSLTLLKKRDETLFGGIAEVLTAPDLKAHIQDNIDEALDDLLRDHAGLNARGLFTALRRVDSRRRKDGIPLESRVLRVPLHLVDGSGLFGEFVGTRGLNEYLLDIARGAEVDEQAEYLASKGRDPVAYLFLSCICLAMGMWEAAKDFAKRALDMPAKSIPGREGLSTARYIFAVAHRMSLSSPEEVKDAERMLEDSVKEHGRRRDEGLLELRALSELAAVRLAAVEHTLYATSAPDDDRPQELVTRQQIPDYLRFVGSTLDTVIHSLENNYPDKIDKLAGFLLQAYANAAAFSTITNLMPDYHKLRRSLKLSDSKLIAGFEETMEMVTNPSSIIKVYLQVLRATSAFRPSDIESLRQGALRGLADVRAMKQALPRMDIEVAEFLAEKLRLSSGS